MNYCEQLCKNQNKETMTISIEKKFLHTPPSSGNSTEKRSLNVKEVFEKVIRDHDEQNVLNPIWIGTNKVEIENKGLSLHTFMLEVERLGLTVEYKQKMEIEIK
jgi:hypothetical protein